MTEPDHYFSAHPATPDERRTITVELAGRPASVQTAGGVFSAGHVDLGTRVLLREVPDPPPSGDLLDLGCGWGPLALTMALLAPQARVWAVDVNERALDLVGGNAQRLGLTNVTPTLPDEVPDEIRVAALWSNPPVRIGKDALHELLHRWLPRLAPGGEAWLVVGRNLGADPLQRWLADELGLPVQRAASAKGFRVLEMRRPDPTGEPADQGVAL